MKSVHLVCNAHLDPVWQWEWEEGVAAAISTFRSAADLCDEFDYIFCHNEVILYEWIREYEPPLFERIKRLVKEGKWHIMGGWYLQPDCNMPSGESFVRQILLGRIYFEKNFGVKPTTACNLDSFGHTRGLVQILKKSGYDSYLFCRPSSKNVPFDDDDFIWVGFAGTSIAARHRDECYNSQLGKAVELIEKWTLDVEKDNDVNMVLWGVGNHGGGPSRKDLADIKKLIAEADYKIAHSTPEKYFEERQNGKPRPERHTNIGPHSVGTYTSMVRIKQKHRTLENELYETEKMVSQAVMQGLMEYPQDDFNEVMKDLAFAEFHDILPGSSIQAAEESSVRLMDHGLEILSRIKAHAFFKLAGGQYKAKEGEYPICVYNPHPYPVKTIVESEFMLCDQNWNKEFSLPRIYQNGVEIPSQPEKEASTIPIDWRKRIVFEAELKPASMNRFECYTTVLKAKPKPTMEPKDGYYKFDNGTMQCWINTKTGLIDRYVVDGKDYLKKDAFKPLVIMDDFDPWGMDVYSFKEICGEFTMMDRDTSAEFAGLLKHELSPIRVIEEGPVRVVIEAFLEYKRSRIVVTYKLSRTSNEVEINYRVYWNEIDRMLKLSIPTVMEDSYYFAQTAFGADKLYDNGDEAVSQKWCAAVSEKDDMVVTVINSSTYGSSFTDGEIRPSVMRAPGYTAHPLEGYVTFKEDRFSPRIDIGERSFTYYLNAGTKQERMEHVGREAVIHSEKPAVLSFSPTGEGSVTGGVVQITGDVIEMSAFKKAELSDDFIIRLFEPSGTNQSTKLTVPLLDIYDYEINFIGYEVKTFKLKKGQVIETDLVENEL